MNINLFMTNHCNAEEFILKVHLNLFHLFNRNHALTLLYFFGSHIVFWKYLEAIYIWQSAITDFVIRMLYCYKIRK